MAAVGNVHLVVIDCQSGPGKHIRTEDRGRPFDRVNIYLPGDSPRAIAKSKSWANDVVPALVDPNKDAPMYRVILHNGEKPGSAAGHFESTRPVT